MKTQVAIVGGGPSGLLLSQLLDLHGIDSIVLERQSRSHVLGRIRAGVLETGMVELLTDAGVGARMAAEGKIHDGVEISWHDERLRIPIRDLTGRGVMVYGQTEVTHDLYAARDARGGAVLHEAEVTGIDGLTGDSPCVSYLSGGREHRLACDVVVGCDGFHGPSRRAIPDAIRHEFERTYPFGWLGLLSATPPAAPEIVYAAHDRGFALCSMRSDRISRYYVQVPLSERLEDWPEQKFWDELRRRIPAEVATGLVTGPALEMSMAPLRSFVSEPMRYGRLYLAGDAAHIVPPTGAKGLNLAASDIYYLHRALELFFNHGRADGLDSYSETALRRVWKCERFSWWMTSILHEFPGACAFDRRMQRAEFDYLAQSETARKSLAENYVGLPY